MISKYTQWLRETNSTLYNVKNTYWRKYNGALVPADAMPVYTHIDIQQAKQLLKQSNAYFLRYSSNPVQTETAWWYIVCTEYTKANLSGSTRSKVNRGQKRCDVKKLEAKWFQKNGYACYHAAHQRYANMIPMSEKDFKKIIQTKINGPFEWWGVFVNDTLVGYCECIIEEKEVATNIIKFNPQYFKQYTSYALFDKLLDHYTSKGIQVSNGNKSIAHDTNMQQFLIKLGFEKHYCTLNIIYRPSFSLIMTLLYKSRKLISLLPEHRRVNQVNALLCQEKIMRQCHNG